MRMNICPREEQIIKYLDRALSAGEKTIFEKHLSDCGICRRMLVDVYKISIQRDFCALINCIFKWFINHFWIICSLTCFLLSFLISSYFMQFLALSVVMAAKSIFDARTLKMLVMISESFKKDSSKKHREHANSYDLE